MYCILSKNNNDPNIDDIPSNTSMKLIASPLLLSDDNKQTIQDDIKTITITVLMISFNTFIMVLLIN